MADEQHQLITILVKYALRQPLDERETRMLEEWRSKSEAHAMLPDQFRDKRWVEEQHKQLHTPPTEEMWAEIRQYIGEEREREPAPVYVLPSRRRIGYAWFSIAAILVLLIVGGGMQWHGKRPNSKKVSAVNRPKPPVNYKVLLTLGDGRLVVLDTFSPGATVAEGGLRLKKTDSNRFVYSADGPIDPSIRHQLMVAPRAGVCLIQWADGSKAWLKAGTTVNYPADIRSGEVQLMGEAWFRVAHDPGRPMVIGMDGVEVRVLGTSFDAQSEAGAMERRVALFSGGVRVIRGADSVLVKSGSQAVSSEKGVEVKKLVDSNAVLGWLRPAVKESYFGFTDADLLTMLPEIAAWYRVQVVNPLELKGVGITGEFMRTTSLSELIKSLNQVEGTHVKLYLQDDSIFVAPLKQRR